jgi:hypothetical protein
MVGAWQRRSGALALSTDRDFERLVLPFLRILWPTIGQAPARKEWDKKGIDFLVWSDSGPFPCAVQCKGFAVQNVGPDQFLQVRSSIEKFRQSGVRADTYLVIHNRDGKNVGFRKDVESLLQPIIESGQAKRAELWNRQQLLVACRSEIEIQVSRALQENAKKLLSYYVSLFLHGATYLETVPVSESRLVFRRFKPCVVVPSQRTASRPASQLVVSATDARWTLLTGEFGSGKTTTVLHASASCTKSPVLIECRSLPARQLNSTSLLLEEGLKSLSIFDSHHEADREMLYELAGTSFKEMLMRPGAEFVLILDGLDENRAYSYLRGMESLSNQLADLQCPIVLTTRREHLNTMFGDFSAAFEDFSSKFSPKRDARLFELQPWSIQQSMALCDQVIAQSEPPVRHRLVEFRELLHDGSFSRLYGDLPSNPLMLRFIIEDVSESGVHASTRTQLLDSWMRQKMRRDRRSTERVSILESMDLEDMVERMIRVMEEISGSMVAVKDDEMSLVEGTSESLVRQVTTAEFGAGSDNLLGIVLNSFLLPSAPSSPREHSLIFAFRILQEFLLAKNLRRTGRPPDGFPLSVQKLWGEMDGSQFAASN